MSAAELNLYNFLKQEFNLTDDKAMKVIKALDEYSETKTKKVSEEYKSIFKEDFYKMDNKIDLKAEELRKEIEKSKSDMIKWFFAFFMALAAMIIGLYLKN